jgi:hypothetical protein
VAFLVEEFKAAIEGIALLPEDNARQGFFEGEHYRECSDTCPRSSDRSSRLPTLRAGE